MPAVVRPDLHPFPPARPVRKEGWGAAFSCRREVNTLTGVDRALCGDYMRLKKHRTSYFTSKPQHHWLTCLYAHEKENKQCVISQIYIKTTLRWSNFWCEIFEMRQKKKKKRKEVPQTHMFFCKEILVAVYQIKLLISLVEVVKILVIKGKKFK